MENPDDPEEDPYPSAWQLQEIRDWLAATKSEVAIFNTCCYGPPHWKLQRFAGVLPGLSSLSSECACVEPHLPLNSPEEILASGWYPPALCESYAKVWVAAWLAANPPVSLDGPHCPPTTPFDIDSDAREKLLNLLSALPVPASRRAAVAGDGVCLGACASQAGAMVATLDIQEWASSGPSTNG